MRECFFDIECFFFCTPFFSSLGANQIVNIDAIGKALETNNTLEKLM